MILTNIYFIWLQQPVANYGNFLAINRQYQNQQSNAYSQQQPSSRKSI